MNGLSVRRHRNQGFRWKPWFIDNASLKTVSFGGGDPSPEGLEDLQLALPNCVIRQ